MIPHRGPPIVPRSPWASSTCPRQASGRSGSGGRSGSSTSRTICLRWPHALLSVFAGHIETSGGRGCPIPPRSDPLHRMLTGQASCGGLTILTAKELFQRYEVEVIILAHHGVLRFPRDGTSSWTPEVRFRASGRRNASHPRHVHQRNIIGHYVGHGCAAVLEDLSGKKRRCGL